MNKQIDSSRSLFGIFFSLLFCSLQLHCSDQDSLAPTASQASFNSIASNGSEVSEQVADLPDGEQADLILAEQTITTTKVFESANSIATGSDFVVEGDADVTFHVVAANGKGRIVLKPGFRAKEGSRFRAFIGADTQLSDKASHSGLTVQPDK